MHRLRRTADQLLPSAAGPAAQPRRSQERGGGAASGACCAPRPCAASAEALRRELAAAQAKVASLQAQLLHTACTADTADTADAADASDRPRPLAGVRVLDLGNVYNGRA